MLSTPLVRLRPLLLLPNGKNGEGVLLADGALVRQVFLSKRMAMRTEESGHEPIYPLSVIGGTYRLENDTR